jgi:hypothetical protein
MKDYNKVLKELIKKPRTIAQEQYMDTHCEVKAKDKQIYRMMEKEGLILNIGEHLKEASIDANGNSFLSVIVTHIEYDIAFKGLKFYRDEMRSKWKTFYSGIGVVVGIIGLVNIAIALNWFK